MKIDSPSRRILRWSAMLFLLAAGLPALAAAHKSDAWARTQFDAAEKLRAALNQDGSHSRHEYQRAIDAYRRIYFAAPASGKADPSVVAVADLLAEMGRRFKDEALLHKAIRQYEFLRREYPGSKDRIYALYSIGRIYAEDLNDPARAQASFAELLRRYPHHHLADDARQALADLQQPKASAENNSARGETASPDQSVGKAGKPNTETVVAAQLARVTAIEHASLPGHTRVTIALDDKASGQVLKFDSQRLNHPARIYFDLAQTKLPARLNDKTIAVGDSFLKRIRAAQFARARARVVLEVEGGSAYQAAFVSDPPRLVIDIRPQAEKQPETKAESSSPQERSTASDRPATAKTEESKAAPQAVAVSEKGASTASIKKTIVEADDDDADEEAPAKPVAKPVVTPASERTRIGTERNVHEAQPTASGDRSLIRALGLKIGKIVIDPGHGGHDTGTIGPTGYTEKELVLDVSLRLGKLLESRLGAEVDYTRDDDTFVPLETRTAIANQDQADLFISIHANSSRDPDARGVETYYLNFTTSRDALEVAARENALSDQSVYELQDLVKKIALKEKIEESHEFASDVDAALHNGLAAKNPGLRDRGVKRAPFIVLIGANMPSILAEISFVSNPEDERRLKTPEYRQRIAEALYRGIARYAGGLSGVKVASKTDKEAQ